MRMFVVPSAEYQVAEIFRGVQGEGWWAGMPCTIVRLAGCNLRCPFCDTKEFLNEESGTKMSLAELVKEVSQVHVTGQIILITGGEPTLQPVGPLVSTLTSLGPVHLETNGTQPFPQNVYFRWITVSPKVAWCGDEARVAISTLGRSDEIKWLVGHEEDILKLQAFLEELRVLQFADYKRVCVQPMSESASATELCYEACLQYGWRLSLQQHKMIGKK